MASRVNPRYHHLYLPVFHPRNLSEEIVMRRPLGLLVAALVTTTLLAADTPDSYGPLGDFKVARPQDKEDVISTLAPAKALVLFDGKNLDQWVKRDGKSPAPWKLVELKGGGKAMEARQGDIITREKFAGHFKLHVEFRVPYKPGDKGQGRGNSGVYLQGRYEVQVLDSYGLKSQKNDCGAIYGVAAPLVNACKAPTVWQSYDIEFWAPTFANGKKVTPAMMTVLHNGVKIHDKAKINVDVTTSGIASDPSTPGPILLQDHGNPVQYRNIWLLQMDK